MPDDKRGREKQSRDADSRQRERAVLEELERMDETEPEVPDAELDELEAEFSTVEFPATGEEVVDAVGDREVAATAKTVTIAELVPETRRVRFDSPRSLRVRITRPTIAGAMKRVIEAAETIPNTTVSESQRRAYERTLREVMAATPDDEDEGVEVVADWIVDRIHEDGRLPGSRAVRKRGADYLRAQGYGVGNDEWLGV